MRDADFVCDARRHAHVWNASHHLSQRSCITYHLFANKLICGIIQLDKLEFDEGSFNMKFAKIIIVTVIVCLFLTSCNTVGSGQTDFFGFKTSVFTVVDEKDTHGGFHGDGSYYLILDCSEETEQAAELINDWVPLPLAENLQLIMYGGTKKWSELCL